MAAEVGPGRVGGDELSDFLADRDQRGQGVSVAFEGCNGPFDSRFDLTGSGFDGCLCQLGFCEPHRGYD